MKKAWKRNDEGVSPVIATILMVAITVVLAAVLYVMVINMSDGPGRTAPPGSIILDVQGSTEVVITFGTFSPPLEPMEIKVRLSNNSDITDVVELTFSNPLDANTVTLGATNGASATYTDINYMGNEVNNGDFIVVKDLNPHTSYTVSIYHAPTQSLCQLVGDTTFNLP